MGGAALGVWFLATAVTPGVAVEFASQLSGASLRRPTAETFTTGNATIGGVSMPAIQAAGVSRIAWDVTIPEGGWVEAHLGVPESEWSVAQDGVLFRIGISFDGRYEEIKTQTVNPSSNAGDRRWVPVAVNVGSFAGRSVSIILNTSAPALWGTPRLVVR